MKPLVPFALPRLLRPSSWLSALRSLRVLARPWQEAKKRKAEKAKRAAAVPRKVREDELILTAINRLKAEKAKVSS